LTSRKVYGILILTSKKEDIMKDKFGVNWNLLKEELCHICGQPDNCGDCNHKKLSKKDIKILKGAKNVYA
jgi:predicted 3-demethylubiquinone-9 3-methyltransferase (glyoxalase superfamily)